jgi:LPXTG-motif cell wall-anchored protein
MIGWGITFLLIGIGSFILPHISERQFILITIFGNGNEHIAGIVYSVIGVSLIGAGVIFGKKKKEGS